MMNIIDLIKTVFLIFIIENKVYPYSADIIIPFCLICLNYNVAIFANNVAVFRRNQ